MDQYEAKHKSISLREQIRIDENWIEHDTQLLALQLLMTMSQVDAKIAQNVARTVLCCFPIPS